MAADGAEANALTLKAGMNVRCGGESANLLQAVRRGLVIEDELNDWVVEPGRVQLQVGASSEDIRQTTDVFVKP